MNRSSGTRASAPRNRSSPGLGLEAQEAAIRERFPDAEIVVEVKSGGRADNRPKLLQIRRELRRGDTLVVAKLECVYQVCSNINIHKWLNVPFDCGVAFCAHPEPHRAAMGIRSDYLAHAEPEAGRDPVDWNPEHSRRARGFAVYAALRSLGRSGVAELVDRCCAQARRFAAELGAHPAA